ncbi:MAG: hypothetical protein RIB47_13920 [Cyclobacteriaceae bacterium]
MKKLLILAAVCFSGLVAAQSNSEDVDFVQSIYGKEKKMIMAEFVQVDDANKDAFWSLYDEYEVKRKAFGKQRIALLEKYADEYLNLDDVSTSKIINETIALGAKTDKLLATYFKKMNKAAGTKPAAQFYQLELFLLSEVRASILESIPFIGELD